MYHLSCLVKKRNKENEELRRNLEKKKGIGAKTTFLPHTLQNEITILFFHKNRNVTIYESRISYSFKDFHQAA